MWEYDHNHTTTLQTSSPSCNGIPLACLTMIVSLRMRRTMAVSVFLLCLWFLLMNSEGGEAYTTMGKASKSFSCSPRCLHIQQMGNDHAQMQRPLLLQRSTTSMKTLASMTSSSSWSAFLNERTFLKVPASIREENSTTTQKIHSPWHTPSLDVLLCKLGLPIREILCRWGMKLQRSCWQRSRFTSLKKRFVLSSSTSLACFTLLISLRYREMMNRLTTLTMRTIHEAKRRRFVCICAVVSTL